MIKESFLLFSSDKLYKQNVNDINPDSISFVTKNGQEKLITQDKTFYFIPDNGKVGQVLKKRNGYFGWDDLNNVRVGTSIANLDPSNNMSIITLTARESEEEQTIVFTNSFSKGQVTTIYLSKASTSEYAPIVVIDNSKYESINGNYRVQIPDSGWISIKFFNSGFKTYAEINDIESKIENYFGGDIILLKQGYNESNNLVDDAVVMNDTNITKNLYEFSVGRYNVSTRSVRNEFAPADGTNSLFTVGNGLDDSHRHDAFRVGQKGEIQIVDLDSSGEYYEKGLFNLQNKLKEIDIKDWNAKEGEPGFIKNKPLGKHPTIPIELSWEVKTGTWDESSNEDAYDGRQFVCQSPGKSSSTKIRCKFKNISKIVFAYRSDAESTFDYLGVGKLNTEINSSKTDTANLVDSTSGHQNTLREYTFSIDESIAEDENFVDFVFSKDGSQDVEPDNATVYIKEVEAYNTSIITLGNGMDSQNTHNAFEVLKNGDVYISDTNAEGEYYEKPMIKLQDVIAELKAEIEELKSRLN